MLPKNEKIFLALLLSTLLILLFAAVVIIAILKYRKKQREYTQREESIKAELIKAVLEAKEQVLEDISDQVHIDIQQTLTLTKINLNKLIYNSSESIQRDLSLIKELLNKSIKEVKSLAHSFDPKMITGHTLEDNIIRQLSRVEKKSEIKTAFNNSKEEIRIGEEKQIFIYRIVQEAINNILSHAKASIIEIDLENLEFNFILRIKDNGIGFDEFNIVESSNIKQKGSGLRSILHRTELMNGTINISSSSSFKTQIELRIPYD